eukprot:153101-Chlamydomonas_euryale.AAC.1
MAARQPRARADAQAGQDLLHAGGCALACRRAHRRMALPRTEWPAMAPWGLACVCLSPGFDRLGSCKFLCSACDEPFYSCRPLSAPLSLLTSDSPAALCYCHYCTSFLQCICFDFVPPTDKTPRSTIEQAWTLISSPPWLSVIHWKGLRKASRRSEHQTMFILGLKTPVQAS